MAVSWVSLFRRVANHILMYQQEINANTERIEDRMRRREEYLSSIFGIDNECVGLFTEHYRALSLNNIAYDDKDALEAEIEKYQKSIAQNTEKLAWHRSLFASMRKARPTAYAEFIEMYPELKEAEE